MTNKTLQEQITELEEIAIVKDNNSDSHHQHGQDAIHHIGSKAFKKKFDVSQDDLILLTNKMLENII